MSHPVSLFFNFCFLFKHQESVKVTNIESVLNDTEFLEFSSLLPFELFGISE